MKKPILIFAILSLIIISPLLLDKYVLTLDMIISPSAIHGVKTLDDFIYGFWANRPNQDNLGLSMSGIPMYLLILFLKIFISASILQKIELFLIFFLSMLSMYLLIDAKPLPRYFAAFFYAINPFVYTRLLAGHWYLLLGYAILPFFVKELLKKDFKVKNIVLWLALIAVFSLHILAMSFLIMLVFIKKQNLKKYLMIAAWFTLINLYWILPSLTTQTSLNTISLSDVDVFITRNQFVNILISNVMLFGFWRAEAYLYPTIFLLAPIFLIIFYLVVHGSIFGKQKRFILLAIIALILAVGVAHPLTEQIYLNLFKLPIIKGFREPNKFIALLSLSYCVLAAEGLKNLKNKKIILALLIIPFIYTPYLFALDLQLKPVDYPKDYYEINNYLNHDKGDFNVLFLPWHLYLDFGWIKNLDKRIANPSQIFFDKPVIKGDNMELFPIYSSSTNPISIFVENNLESADNLTMINVRYIVVAKEYGFSINDTILIKETENLKVYRNNAKTSKFYVSDDLIDLKPIEYEKLSPIHYRAYSDKKYIVFTQSYNPAWIMGDQQPLEGYPVNIFENNGKDIVRQGFAKLLIIYSLSLLFLMILLLDWYFLQLE